MTSPNRPRHLRAIAALAVASVLLLGACGSDSDGGSSDGSSSDGSSASAATIKIGSQKFSESETLAEVYAQFLKAKGFDIQVEAPIADRTQLFAAMDKGSVDLELDYTGSAVTELGGTASSDADATYADLEKALADKGWVAADQSEAADANALVALTSWADENHVTKISDLADLDGPLTLGGAPECADREDCLAGYNGPTYDLGLEFVQVAYGPALVTALQSGDIDVAQYGSTAPEIAEGTIVVLEDDQGLQSAQNVVPIIANEELATDDLLAALNELSAEITTEDLAAWNLATDGDAKEDPADVAQSWLEDKGLI
ncbi:MAG: ABC transporter substrate-binding protein [Actinobacteria bacterium]|nr:ABC transporter substrate-binding protein [Actinomycetota bacterium]